MSKNDTFLETALNAARIRADPVVTAFLDNLNSRVEEVASAVPRQRSIFAIETKRTVEIDVGTSDATSFFGSQTPTTSNTTTERTMSFSNKPTKRIINMPPEPRAEMMLEELLNLMCELGYDSDGEPTYFGDMEEE